MNQVFTVGASLSGQTGGVCLTSETVSYRCGAGLLTRIKQSRNRAVSPATVCGIQNPQVLTVAPKFSSSPSIAWCSVAEQWAQCLARQARVWLELRHQ